VEVVSDHVHAIAVAGRSLDLEVPSTPRRHGIAHPLNFPADHVARGVQIADLELHVLCGSTVVVVYVARNGRPAGAAGLGIPLDVKYALGERGLRSGDLTGATRTDGLCTYWPCPTWQEPKEPNNGSDDHGCHDRLLVLDHGWPSFTRHFWKSSASVRVPTERTARRK